MNMYILLRAASLVLVPAGLSVAMAPGLNAAGTGHGNAVGAATRSATVEPSRANFVNAGAVYAFRPNALYRVHTAPERVTDIALEPGESLVAVASGDTVRWIIGDTESGSGAARRVHVLVKPVAAGLATNLVITTDRRAYHLELTSAAGAAMTALSWNYPQDALLALRREQGSAEAAKPLSTGIDIEKLDFAYDISGDRPAWRPLRAFDDGRQSFIEFPRSITVGEAPPLFLRDGEGELALVNYRAAGRFYIVDRLFDAAELRLGQGEKQAVVRIVRTPGAGRLQRSGS